MREIDNIVLRSMYLIAYYTREENTNACIVHEKNIRVRIIREK